MNNTNKLIKNFLPIALVLSQTIGISSQYSFYASAAPSKSDKSTSVKSLDQSSLSATGLDAKTFQAMNEGRFNDAMDLLVSQTANDTTINQKHAWLAFTYMFLSKCKEVDDLSKKFDQTKDSDAYKLTEGFNLICQNKIPEAKTMLSGLSSNKDNDVLSNLALAAVNAKSGAPTQAIDYCQKAVTLAPSFAWGYRTIGFLQDKLLKDPVKAQAAYEQALQIEPKFKEVRDLLVNLYSSQNNFDQAIDSAEAAIKLSPKNADNYYRLAQIYIQQFRFKEATGLLDKCIALDPNNSRFHRSQANILRSQGRVSEAIVAQQKAVDLSTDKAFELIELANLNELAGNTNKAIDNLKEALKLSSTNQAAQQKLVALLTNEKRFDDLVEEYKRAISQTPKQADLRMGLANAYIALGKNAEAIDSLKEAGSLSSTDPRPYRQLGFLYFDQKDYPSAIKAYTRALNINPNSVDDLACLGLSYARNKDYMQAETAFVTAVALHQLTGAPVATRLDLMRSLAEVLLAEGRYTEAVVNLEVVAASKPADDSDKAKQRALENKLLLLEAKALRNNTKASDSELITYFNSLSAADQDKYRLDVAKTFVNLKRADLILEQVGKVDSKALQDNSDWLTVQATGWRLKGDLAKASASADAASKVNNATGDQLANAYIELGQIQATSNKADEAISNLKKATDSDPKSFIAFEQLGRIYLQKSDAKNAEASAKKSIEINPYHVKAYLLLGDIYNGLGQAKDAENSYRHAVELSPASIDAHRSLSSLYKKLAQKENAQKEEDTIAQIEKHNLKGE